MKKVIIGFNENPLKKLNNIESSQISTILKEMKNLYNIDEVFSEKLRINDSKISTQEKNILFTYYIEVDNHLLDKTLDLLKKLNNIRYIEVSQELYLFDDIKKDIGSNNPQVDQNKQYSLYITEAEKSWDYINAQEEVIVAVLDSGVTKHHNITVNLLDGYNAINQSNDTTDNHGHGTHCAGIVSAIPNLDSIYPLENQIFSSNIFAKILPIKITDDGRILDIDAANGIIYAAGKANVLSCSWGRKKDQNDKGSNLLHDAINFANEKGCILVFAAGNDFENVEDYTPQDHPNIIRVAATDTSKNSDNRWEASNYGDLIDISAPGHDILSLSNIDGQYSIQSGTSMACPHIAGLIAGIFSINPSLSLIDIKLKLKNGSVKVHEEFIERYDEKIDDFVNLKIDIGYRVNNYQVLASIKGVKS